MFLYYLICYCVHALLSLTKFPGEVTDLKDENKIETDQYRSNIVLGGDRGKSEDVYSLDGSQIVSIT